MSPRIMIKIIIIIIITLEYDYEYLKTPWTQVGIRKKPCPETRQAINPAEDGSFEHRLLPSERCALLDGPPVSDSENILHAHQIDCVECLVADYYYYYYLIKFNVRIEPFGCGRLIIHVFVSLVAPLHSTFILALHGLYGQGFRDAAGDSTDPSLSRAFQQYIHR